MTKEDRDGGKLIIKDVRNAMTEDDITAAYDRGEEVLFQSDTVTVHWLLKDMPVHSAGDRDVQDDLRGVR